MTKVLLLHRLLSQASWGGLRDNHHPSFALVSLESSSLSFWPLWTPSSVFRTQLIGHLFQEASLAFNHRFHKHLFNIHYCWGRPCYLHFIDKETEIQRKEAKCLCSYSHCVTWKHPKPHLQMVKAIVLQNAQWPLLYVSTVLCCSLCLMLITFCGSNICTRILKYWPLMTCMRHCRLLFICFCDQEVSITIAILTDEKCLFEALRIVSG